MAGIGGSFTTTTEKKAKVLGFLHYKTWVTPATGAKKRTLNITIIAADGLEQGVFARYPYVKIVHTGTDTQKTPTSQKSVAVRLRLIFLASLTTCRDTNTDRIDEMIGFASPFDHIIPKRCHG